MSGQVTDCMYYQLQGKCTRGPKCVFYHRQLEPDICRSFLFHQCKYGNNTRRCGKRHVTARDLPAVTNKERERVKQAKINYKEALAEFNKPVTNDEEMDEVKEEAKFLCLDCCVELATPWDVYNHQVSVQHCDVIKKICEEGKEVLGVEGDEDEWCTGCNVRIKEGRERKEHDKGEFHISMAESLKKTEIGARTEQKFLSCFHCKISNIPCSQMRSHLYSEKHVNVLKRLFGDKDETPTASGDKQRRSLDQDNYPGVFVANLPASVGDWEIERKFEKFGKIMRVILPKITGEHDVTWSIVRFEKRDDAEKAIEALNNTGMEGRKLQVRWKDDEKRNQNKMKELAIVDGISCVYVGNLPLGVKCLEIKQMFEKFAGFVKVIEPKVNMEKDFAYAFVYFEKVTDAETAIEAANNKWINGRRLIMNLKKNMKYFYFCELCEVYCTCQANLDKHFAGRQHLAATQQATSSNHERLEQTKCLQLNGDILDATMKAANKTVPQLSEFPSINGTAFKLSSLVNMKSGISPKQMYSAICKSPKKQEAYSTICKSPKKQEASRISKPLGCPGEGRRHLSDQIECTMCASMFKSTRDFANHCISSEDHKAATRMMEQTQIKRSDDENKDKAQDQAANKSLEYKIQGAKRKEEDLNISLETKMQETQHKDQMMQKAKRKEDQNQLLLQHMAAQNSLHQQMYPKANGGLPLHSNPYLLHDGLGVDPLFNPINRFDADPLLYPRNGSGIDQIFNPRNGSVADPVMLVNQIKQQVPQQSDIILQAEQMALGQLQETIYNNGGQVAALNMQAFNNAQIENDMYMRALARKQTELQLQQIYYENKRMAAQMDLNAHLERVKQVAEMEKQNKQRSFLEQVEIGRLEELRKLKMKESDSNNSKAVKKHEQSTHNNNEACDVNTEIFHSDDEEEEGENAE